MSIRQEIVDQVGVLTLDRTACANAYDRAHLTELHEAFFTLEESVAVIVIRSAGDGAFCAGADLNEMKTASPEDARNLHSQAVFRYIAESHAISIAAVHGPAIGGGFELALAADLRIVGPQARFAFPETQLGIIPAAGGCTHLARHVGVSMAKAVIIGGRQIDATEAVSLGLALRQAADPRQDALALAHELSTRDRQALQSAKAIVGRGAFDESLSAERAAQALLYERKQSS